MSTIQNSIRSEADRCVVCGLCLPHCPTFRLTGDESESPRGRIGLMAALAEGRIEPTPPALRHLDHCLGCRACERMCPSEVRFGALLRDIRAMHPLKYDTPSPPAGRLARTALAAYRRSGVQALVRASGVLGQGRLARLEALLPDHGQERFGAIHSSEEGGEVALFAGCTGRAFDSSALAASETLLRAFGFGVRMLDGLCCGSIELNRGAREAAREQAHHTIEAAADTEKVIGIASGCTAALTEYPAWLDDGESAHRFAARVTDVVDFLAGEEWPAGLALRPLKQRIAVHMPCSARNVLRSEEAVYRLLAHIPGADIVPLPGNELCCGAAGDYMLREPRTADRLRALKVEAAAETRPDIIVSSNVGCALHVAAGLREAGLDIEVLHPVVLLARQALPD